LALAHEQGVPAVAFGAFSLNTGEPEYTAAALPSSHVPTMMSGFSNHITFLERAMNLGMKTIFKFIFSYHFLRIDWMISKHLPNSPKSTDLLGNISGGLVNTNFFLDFPSLQPKSFLNVGGLQIKNQTMPISDNDIKRFLDEGKDGVIYFSMGYIMDTSRWTDEWTNKLFSVLSRLPQRILMKLDALPTVPIPSNVMIKHYVPQQDVLAHPNIILFFTHFGGHSVFESVWHAVPMVGIPIYLDQVDIVTKIEYRVKGCSHNNV
jgi:glucuronosyltransferase